MTITEQYNHNEFTRSEFQDYMQALQHYNLAKAIIVFAVYFKFGMQKKYWTVDEMSREYGVTRRSIQRYISPLVELGIMGRFMDGNSGKTKYHMK